MAEKSVANIGRDLLNVPFGDMIRDMALAIAEAQLELDEAGIEATRQMGSASPDKKVAFGGESYSMLELGFTPTFYQFVDTIIEVKMAIKLTREDEDVQEEKERTSKSSGLFRRLFRGNDVKSTTVDATYSSKYSYSAEGSSLLRTKLVPVPAPSVLEQRIRNMIEQDEGS